MIKLLLENQYGPATLVSGDYLGGRSFSDAVELYRLSTGLDGTQVLLQELTEHNQHMGEYKVWFYWVLEGEDKPQLTHTFSRFVDEVEDEFDLVGVAADGIPLLRTKPHVSSYALPTDEEIIVADVVEEEIEEVSPEGDVPVVDEEEILGESVEEDFNDLEGEDKEVVDDITEDASEEVIEEHLDPEDDA